MVHTASRYGNQKGVEQAIRVSLRAARIFQKPCYSDTAAITAEQCDGFGAHQMFVHFAAKALCLRFVKVTEHQQKRRQRVQGAEFHDHRGKTIGTIDTSRSGHEKTISGIRDVDLPILL